MTPVETGVKVPDESVASDTSVTPGEDGAKKVSSSAKRTRKRKPDAAPKKAAKRPSAGPEESTFTTSELEDALAQILTFPAVPCAMAGDEWGASHFAQTGRVFAHNLAQQAEKNPTIRKWCIRIAQGEAVGTLAISAVMYAFPPLVHWGIIPIPNEARAMIPGMPPPVVETEEPAPSHTADHVPGNINNGSNTGRQTP